jgi:hypothetical protein
MREGADGKAAKLHFVLLVRGCESVGPETMRSPGGLRTRDCPLHGFGYHAREGSDITQKGTGGLEATNVMM